MSLSPDVYGIVFKRGEVICREGDLGDTMYVIQSGAVEVSRQSAEHPVILAILEHDKLSPWGEWLIGRCIRLFDPCLSCATH